MTIRTTVALATTRSMAAMQSSSRRPRSTTERLSSRNIAGLFDADFEDIADPNIVMIDDDGGGASRRHGARARDQASGRVRLPDLSLASVWRKQSLQFQFQTKELAVSAVKPWQQSKDGFVSTPRPVPSTKPKKRVQNKLKKHAGAIAHPIKLVHQKISTEDRKQEAYLLGGGTSLPCRSARSHPVNAMQELTVTMARQCVASQAHG